MREYKPIRTETWWILQRKKQMWKLILLQYLNSHTMRTPNKWSARVFYTQNSIESAITVMKIKDKKKSDE
jgi:hypothetical protein